MTDATIVAFTNHRSRYLEDFLALAAQPLSAMRVLELAEDPNASTAELARVVESDPILSVQVLRLANSASYGLSGTVASANRAVSLLGFTTVRALAVTAVCGLMDSRPEQYEPGFWAHAAASAIGAGVVARRTAVSPQDAFSAGMLHDLGCAILYRRHGNAYRTVRELASSSTSRLLEGEREAFGTTHVEVGVDLMTHLRMPSQIVSSVAQHHSSPQHINGSLSKVVAAGIALADLYEKGSAYDPGPDLGEVLGVLGLPHVSPKELLADLHAEARTMSGALGLGDQ